MSNMLGSTTALPVSRNHVLLFSCYYFLIRICGLSVYADDAGADDHGQGHALETDREVAHHVVG